MPSKKVTLVHKDLPEQPVTVGERRAAVMARNGWKTAPKTQQPDPAQQ